MTKNGTGTLTLSGTNTHTGATTVNAGTLLVNGSQLSSPVSLAGGVLGGTGTVRTITSTGGTVAPGASTGILTSAGSVNFTAASTFSVDANGTTAGSGHDQLIIGPLGSVALGGSTLAMTFGFTPPPGTAFTIIDNQSAGPVVGAFANAPAGTPVTFGGVTGTVSYTGGTGNDVVFRVRAPLSVAINNIALNRPASGSTPCAANEGPEKAFNGTIVDVHDKWCSLDPNPKFLKVDLGSTTNVGRFVLRHAGAGGETINLNTRDFDIEVSTDDVSFTPVVTVMGNTLSVTTHDIVSAPARYVRIRVNTPTQTADNAARIFEFEVMAAGGIGTGTVTSNVAGINCPADCFESYDHGTVVTLTAAQGAGSVFDRWSGACTNTTTMCNVTMDQARSVTAIFATTPHQVTMLFAPTATNPPTYSWQSVADASWYYLYVTGGPGGAPISQFYSASESGCPLGTEVCSIMPPGMIAAGSHTFWIRTWNQANGYGPWSAGRTFTVAGDVPVAATLVSPTGNIATNQPTYTWNAVSNASWYYLFVGHATAGTQIAQFFSAAEAGCPGGTGQCSVTPNVTLPSGHNGWFIRTWNPVGFGPWSTGLDFNVP